MTVIRVATSLSLCLLLCEIAPVSAATTTVQRAQIQAARAEIEELNAQQSPDTVFQFNTGLDKPKELAGALSQILTPQARDLVDVDLGSFHDAQLENAEKRLNRQFEEKGNIRRGQVHKLDQKHKRYQKLEVEIAVNQTDAQQRVDASLEKKNRQQEHASASLKADIRTQTHRIESGKARQQQVSTRKAKLAKSRSTTGYLKIRQEIAATKSKIAAMQTAMQRKARFDRGSALLGVVLTAVSSEMEENALARQEGRPPLAANKVINFAKNVSGYSTVKGVMDNVEMAKMEAMVSTLEFFETNGFDLNDPETQKLAMQRAEDAARRAVARTALYEGSKLAPVIGDLVSIKEGFDAAGDTYVAVEEATYIITGNEEAQFQTSLRGAIKVEAKVRQMEAIAAQSKLLIASLGKLKEQLLVMEHGAEANRDKLRQAVSLLETYNEQAAALSSPTVANDFQPASIETLLGRLNAVKATADEQAGNMQRIKAEHQSGQLTAQGVATQARFIGDLLQPAIADHAALQPALSRIEDIGRSNELAAQVPATLEFLHQAKAVMQQQGERSNQLDEIYREQAGTLERLARQFQELRGEMPKYLAYVQSRKNLEDQHQDKIRAALDRANKVDIDQTALRRVIDDARGRHNSAGLAGALADLDKTPGTVDTSTVNALVQQAQQAWALLVGPNQAAAESLRKTQDLLHELAALAGDAKPAEVESPKDIEFVAENIQMGLFKGKNWLDISPNEIEQVLSNRTADMKRASNNFFGYKASERTGDLCRTTKGQFCPGYDYLFKIITSGETRWNEGRGRTGKAPYWIAAEFSGMYVKTLLSSAYTAVPYDLEEHSSLKNEMKRENTAALQYEFSPVNISGIDEAMVQQTNSLSNNPSIDVKVHARKGPVIFETHIKVGCQIEPYEVDGYVYTKNLNFADVTIRPDDVTQRFDENFIQDCADSYAQLVDLHGELLSNLAREVDPLLANMKKQFYFKPIDFSALGYKDMPINPKSYNTTLISNKKASFYLDRKKIISMPPHKHEMTDKYDITIEMIRASGNKGWNQVIEEFDANVKQRFESNIGNYKEQPTEVTINGADYAKLSKSSDQYTWSDFVAYGHQEHLFFRIANIGVSIKASVRAEAPGTRTLELANAIASKILASPRGW